MTTKDAFALKKYTPVLHKWLGHCIVIEIVPEFGPVILPITAEGLHALSEASGMPPGIPYLCSDYKQRLKHIIV